MKKRPFSFSMQIFLSSVALIALPIVLLGSVFTKRTLDELNEDYTVFLRDITGQVNISIDTLLSGAETMSHLHLVNDDINAALNKRYDENSLEFARTYNMMRNSILQTLRFNPSVEQVVFIGRHGQVYDYGFTIYSDLLDTLERVESWRGDAARGSGFTYYGPVRPAAELRGSNNDILPMVCILKDLRREGDLGILYVGFKLRDVASVVEDAEMTGSSIAFFDTDNNLFYNSGSPGADDPELSGALLDCARQAGSGKTVQVKTAKGAYTVYSAANRTTGWKLVHYLDNSTINSAYRANVMNFLLLFFIVALLDLMLAFLLSRSLTRNVSSLCRKIDECEDGRLTRIDLSGATPNRELQKLIDSYNSLNARLAESIRQNYAIRLNEKQMELRMLQAQINPHFLYNTLNLIGSIANIHNIPEIRQIAASMSDLLRYNLKSGPIVLLGDEVQQVRRYIDIQQTRFPDKFRFECHVPRELQQTRIPVFTLQPIIENAVVHGLDEKESGGYLTINVFAKGDELHILVADNGAGIAADGLIRIRASLRSKSIREVSGDSIGILNVHQRIRAYYGGGCGLDVRSSPGGGTVVDIRLPLDREPQFPPALFE